MSKPDLDAVQARITDCQTYRFGMFNADKLAHEDAAALLAYARDLEARVGRVEAIAETWRYKGEFGWGAWQEGHGPDFEGWLLDKAASEVRAALTATEES